jgi:ADP-ribose pyrophosphatase YjhB (NUDIX family)
MAFQKLSPEELRKHKGTSFTGIGTIFWCYNDNNQLFWSKRSANARDEQGTWEPGGGGLKFGQTLEDNIRRELKEEYDAEPLQMEFMGYRDNFRKLPDGTPTHWLCMDFAVRVDPSTVRINEPDMIDDSGWYELGKQPGPLHSQIAVCLDKYQDKLQTLMIRAQKSKA